MSTGVKSNNISNRTSIADEYVVNRDGSTALQSFSDLKDALVGQPPFSSLLSAAASGIKAYDTKAALDLITAPEAKTLAKVINDADPQNNATWRKVGAAGIDGWEILSVLDVPFLLLTNSSTGTADAIIAVAPSHIPVVATGVYFVLPVLQANPGPLTLSVNGRPPKDIKTNSDADLAANYLTAGMYPLLVDAGTHYRLISYGDVSAIQAAAETAQAAAEAAAAAITGIRFPTVALASAYAPVTAPEFLSTAGYAAAGDGGEADYVKVAAEPAHTGKLSITLNDGVTVVWYEVYGDSVNAMAFGAKADTVSVAATVSITSGTPNLTATGATFTSADVGKLIDIPGAGAAGIALGSTIAAYVGPTQVTLADNASTTLTAVAATITYGTDDTTSLTSAQLAGTGRETKYPASTCMITKAIPFYTNTVISGTNGVSTIRLAAKYTGAATYEGAAFVNATFGTAAAYSETDVIVQNMVFDYTSRGVGSTSVGQKVSVFARYVDRIKVLGCVQRYGQMTGLLRCRDTQISDNLAYECENAAYDQWSSTGFIIVSNNITRNVVIAPNQCIQVTADDTVPGAPTLLGTGHVEKIVIEGNVIDVLADGTVSGIIVNCIGTGSSGQDVVIGNNYVRGPNYGIVIQGNINGFVIDGNVVRDVVTQGILTINTVGTTFPTDGVISNNMVKGAGSIGIDIDFGDKIIVTGNRVATSGVWGIRLQSDASNCHVHGNMVDAGSSGKIVNLGTNNLISTPEAVQARYDGSSVYNAAAPTTFTDIDLSAKVGAYRALCYCRVANLSASVAKYVFRT